MTVPLGVMCAYRRLTMRLQEVKLTSKSSGPFPREGATPYGYESGHVAPGECGIDSIAVGVFENVDGDCDCVLASRESARGSEGAQRPGRRSVLPKCGERW